MYSAHNRLIDDRFLQQVGLIGPKIGYLLPIYVRRVSLRYHYTDGQI